jgi:hypothetical protein
MRITEQKKRNTHHQRTLVCGARRGFLKVLNKRANVLTIKAKYLADLPAGS